MKPSQKIDSFIVRIWREQVPASRKPELLRGSIEHVQSREKEYFQGIEALLKILQAQTRSTTQAKCQGPDDQGKS